LRLNMPRELAVDLLQIRADRVEDLCEGERRSLHRSSMKVSSLESQVWSLNWLET
jgi:hypothetical protein